jgi:hypothetical protein
MCARTIFPIALICLTFLFSCSSEEDGAAPGGEASQNNQNGDNDLFDTPVCNYQDDPDSCDDWVCYEDDRGTVCERSRPDRPDGGGGWTCSDDARPGYTTCWRDDDAGGGSGDDDCYEDADGEVHCDGDDDPGGGDNGWDCTEDPDNNREICTDDPDTPTDDPGWDCWEEEDRRICTHDDPDEPNNPILTDCGDPTGNINGRLCAPSGVHWVVGANVSVTYRDCNGNAHVIQTQTDAEGYFVLVGVGLGTQTVHAEKGPYRADFEVTVEENRTTTIPLGDFCFDQSTNIAVVTGEYDKVELVLDHLGFTYDLYDGFPSNDGARQLLGDLGRMNDYDVIFMDCGTTLQGIFDNRPVLDAVRSNVESYISSGGRMYVSDWDWLYIEEPFPGRIDFAGEDDLAQQDVLTGAAGYSLARVRDAELAAALGEDRVTIQFDYPNWAVVDAVGEDVRVFLSADVSTVHGALIRDVPVLMSFRYGQGEVIYTSYHVHQNDAINSIFIYTVLGFE